MCDDATATIQDLARVQMDDDRFVQVPLRAMAKHIQVRDEDGWYIACCFLRSLAHQSDAKKVALCHQGAVRALQHSMHVFRASARVQTVAISCLHVLAFVEANRAEIGQRSCVGLVVGALQAHMDDAILVLCGCRLLQMVALNDAFKVRLAIRFWVKSALCDDSAIVHGVVRWAVRARCLCWKKAPLRSCSDVWVVI